MMSASELHSRESIDRSGEFKAVLAMSAPIVISTCSPLVMRVADFAFVATLGTEAQAAMDGEGPLEGAVSVQATFYLPRRKSPRPKKQLWPDRRPDVDKLARSLLDALTNIAFGDDNQVCDLFVRKVYASEDHPPGVEVEVAHVLAVFRISDTG